jgi:hypothetical protein
MVITTTDPLGGRMTPSNDQVTPKPVPMTPYRQGEDQVEATRRTSDELEQAVRRAIDQQTGRK